ncbi:MAG: hypothetical protein RLY21_2668 [Planctomycetota bacterium]|jgi:hypothetical protein
MQRDSMQSGGMARGSASTQPASPRPAASAAFDATPLRWVRRILRLIGAVSAVTLLFALIGEPMLVSASALSLAGACLLLVVLDIGQTRSRVATAALRSGLGSGEAARKAGVRTAIRLTLAVGLAAFAVVATMLDRTTLIAGSAFALAAVAIFGAPAWLATVGDNEAMTSADVEAQRGNRS